MKVKNIFGHLKTILVHKFWVFHYTCKLGIPWRGFWHDMSKFHPIEFWESVKFYQGGKESPIPVAKAIQGYSLAWLHHKAHNPHHYEYWTDNYDTGTTCIKMPWKYFLEMIADYLAAGRTYCGDSFTYKYEYEWWLGKKDYSKMNEITKEFLTEVLYHFKVAEWAQCNLFNKGWLHIIKYRYENE